LPQLRAQFGKPPEATEFWHPLEQLPPGIGPVQRRRLERAYRREISLVIEPAYRRLHEFLVNEYLPRARSTVGLGEVPGRAALYGYEVRHHTTTTMPPGAIHDLGVAEVERIETELGKLRAQVDFAGDLPAFFERVRTDPALKFAARSDIVPGVDRGVRWMMAHSSMNDAQARAEVERYVAYPAQALSYKVGELKIRELRRRAEQALGGRFDIKAFHDVILTGGSRSLRILEEDVDRWIAGGQ
jgi:uncharacterized protein (DUF885 family)